MTLVTVLDETTSGGATNTLTLDFLTERVTVRELIRARIYQEVTEYNAALPERFKGLVQPVGSRPTPDGYLLPRRGLIDWEAQLLRALEAFQTNGFILLVDDKQLTSLDDEIELRHDSSICFLRLVPLVGG